jgi:hypothetical protein
MDSCLIKGFSVLASTSTDIGNGIVGIGQAGLITMNRVTSANIGIFLDDSDIEVNNNICSNIKGGIRIENSSSLVKKNTVAIDETGIGIHVAAIDLSYMPIIDSNYIETVYDGINISFGTKPTIINNTILLKNFSARGYVGSFSDTVKVFNNVIIAEKGRIGFLNSAVPTLVYNNYLTGNFDDTFDQFAVIIAGDFSVLKNNVVTNSERGIKKTQNHNPVIVYNNSWNNDINYLGFTPDSTNLSVDPMIVNDDTTYGKLDFHLQKYSPLIDAGDPNILDIDGTRSDIGLYGGPYGESYTYLDLAPKPPRNLIFEIDSIIIVLGWNRNSEADFNHYNLYRDTVTSFTIDSTKLISSQTDTFYIQTVPHQAKNLYYKVTAVDNQGNESSPSEEVSIILVSVREKWQAVNNYILYQNYPNPFNPSTKIGYKLKERGHVKLYVYDVKGELVEMLVNQTQEAGYYEVEFNGEGKTELLTVKNPFVSGVYLCQIMVQSEKGIPVFSDIKKMILLK